MSLPNFQPSADLDGGIGSHRHRWRLSATSYGGKVLEFRCSVPKCQAQVVRRATKEEYPLTRHNLSEHDGIHTIWWDFQKRFCKEQGWPPEWKLTGYDLMCAVEKWAKKFPQHVQVIRCDDAVNANSDLVLIEHRTEDRYFGTTVVFIPQCTGENPTSFFLYQQHRVNLLKALMVVGKRAWPSMVGEKAREKAEADQRAAVLKLPSSTWRKK